MCGQPFSLLLCSGGIEVTFKQLFQRRNLLKFGVVLPNIIYTILYKPDYQKESPHITNSG